MITALCLLLSALLGAAPTPGETLTASMILFEITQHDVANPGLKRTDPGQCRMFQINSFAAVSAGYALMDYPDAVLYLPFDHNDAEETGRTMGIAWDMPGPETGNAFMEVARFDYDKHKSYPENLKAAKAFLSQVRAGDLLQMMGTYSSGGHGTHTVLFTRPYDQRLDTLYWSDSNFAFREVNGEKYGVVRAYGERELEQVAGWIAERNGNGATLYRLREDVVRR